MPQGQFEVHSNGRREFIDLSGRIRTIVSESGMQDGLLVLHNPHTTAGLTINEGADADVQKDILNTLARMAPDAASPRYVQIILWVIAIFMMSADVPWMGAFTAFLSARARIVPFLALISGIYRLLPNMVST